MFDSKTIKNAQNATEPASAFDKFELAEQIFLSFRRELREKGCCPTTVSGRARPCATAVFSFAPWHLPGTNDETAILHLRCKATKLDPNRTFSQGPYENVRFWSKSHIFIRGYPYENDRFWSIFCPFWFTPNIIFSNFGQNRTFWTILMFS